MSVYKNVLSGLSDTYEHVSQTSQWKRKRKKEGFIKQAVKDIHVLITEILIRHSDFQIFTLAESLGGYESLCELP